MVTTPTIASPLIIEIKRMISKEASSPSLFVIIRELLTFDKHRAGIFKRENFIGSLTRGGLSHKNLIVSLLEWPTE